MNKTTAATPGGRVRTRKRGHVLEVTLDRPERYNALHPDLWKGLDKAFQRVEREDDITVVLLRGAGGNFCAGGDLQSIHDGDSTFAGPERKRLDELHWQHGLVTRMVAAPALTIALIEGVAIGGGFDISLSCDLRIATPDARIASRYTLHGIVPDLGGMFLLPRVVPHPAAAALILSGAMISGREAHELGLVQILAEDGDVRAAADVWVQRMASAQPQGVRLAKAGLVRQTLEIARQSLPESAALQTVLTTSTEFRDAVERFATRKPRAAKAGRKPRQP